MIAWVPANGVEELVCDECGDRDRIDVYRVGRTTVRVFCSCSAAMSQSLADVLAKS